MDFDQLDKYSNDQTEMSNSFYLPPPNFNNSLSYKKSGYTLQKETKPPKKSFENFYMNKKRREIKK